MGNGAEGCAAFGLFQRPSNSGNIEFGSDMGKMQRERADRSRRRIDGQGTDVEQQELPKKEGGCGADPRSDCLGQSQTVMAASERSGGSVQGTMERSTK